MVGTKRTAGGTKLPTKQELLQIINSLDTLNTRRDRALVALEYLTGSRVSELIGDVRRIQIEKKNIVGVNFLVINEVKVLKRRKAIKRTILIPIEKEKEFVRIVVDYINTLEANDLLFDMTRQRAWQIIKDNTGLFNHLFRHMRATHLTTDYGFSAQELKQFFGWASTTQADTYSHLSQIDIARKMAI